MTKSTTSRRKAVIRMSRKLKKIESPKLVRTLIDPEQMDEKVTDLSEYSRRDTLVAYTGKINPTILAAWSMLLEGLQEAYGDDAIVAEGLSVFKARTRAELEDSVVENVRSDRYWHPDRYTDITEDMIEDPES